MQTLYDALRQIAVDYGDSPFLCVPPRSDRPYLPQGAEITFAEMLAAVDTLADAWERAGWGEGTGLLWRWITIPPMSCIFWR